MSLGCKLSQHHFPGPLYAFQGPHIFFVQFFSTLVLLSPAFGHITLVSARLPVIWASSVCNLLLGLEQGDWTLTLHIHNLNACLRGAFV